jgi:hypothetical protein
MKPRTPKPQHKLGHPTETPQVHLLYNSLMAEEKAIFNFHSKFLRLWVPVRAPHVIAGEKSEKMTNRALQNPG